MIDMPSLLGRSLGAVYLAVGVPGHLRGVLSYECCIDCTNNRYMSRVL